jgi:hypothetical protein
MSAVNVDKGGFDVSNSLPVVALTPIVSIVALLVSNAMELSDTAAGTMVSSAAGLPGAGALVLHRLRTTPRQRAEAIASDNMAINSFILLGVLGSLLALADSVLGGAIGMIVGTTVAAAADMGVTQEQQVQLAQLGFGASFFVALPTLAIIAVFAGRRAAHYVEGNKLALLAAAAAFYVVIRLAIVFAAGGMLASAGVLSDFLSLAPVYLVIGFGLTLFLWLGAAWSRRTHEAFVGERLLAQLSPDDRRAALDLLREETARPSSA